MDTIQGMRAFVAVARQRSFTAGAKELSMSTKLASKYVKQLEEKIGAQLLHRTTRSVTLTATGQAYYNRCLPLLDQFDELEGLVQEEQTGLAGTIRLTAPTGYGSTKLADALVPFQHAHPNVGIDLHLLDNRVSLVDEGFDLAVRFGKLQDSTLIARKLRHMPIVVFASPEYLAHHGNPKEPAALQSHNCLLQQSATDPNHWQFDVNGKNETVRVNGTFQANSPKAVAQMAAGGLGIAMGPLYATEPYLQSGELQLILEEHCTNTLGLYAVYPPSRQLTARVRALIDHLATALAE